MNEVRVQRSGPGRSVARVTLARPQVRNALDEATIGLLTDAFTGLAAEGAATLRAVVLAGEDPVFCAGGDRAWMQRGAGQNRAANEADSRALGALFAAIDACPVPVIARVQGAAMGGGAGMCAVSDVVVAERGAVFAFPEVRIGLVAGTISPYVLARIGEAATRRLFLTGERFDAEEARRIGLVDVVADGAEGLDAAVARVLDDMLAGAPGRIRDTKRLIRELRGLPAGSKEAAELTVRALADARASDEAAEGLRAANERRTPSWAEREDR